VTWYQKLFPEIAAGLAQAGAARVITTDRRLSARELEFGGVPNWARDPHNHH